MAKTTLTTLVSLCEALSGLSFCCSKKKVKAENGTQNLIIQGKKCDKGYVTQRRRV